MTFKKARRYATRPNHVLSTHARVKSAVKCGTLTRLRKMCVRREVLSSPTVAYQGIDIACKRNLVEKINECARILQNACHIGFAKSDRALVPVPLMPGCDVRDVDRREVVRVSAIFFSPSVGLLRIAIPFHPLAT